MEGVTSEFLTPIGIIVLIIVLVLGPIAKKLDLSIFKRSEKNPRIISDNEIDKLLNHNFFIEADKIKTRTLKNIYANSKKEFPQQIFILFNHYYIEIMKQDILYGIKNILKEKNEDAKYVTTELEKILLHITIHFEEETYFIPKKIRQKFLVWYEENSKWYYESINKIISIDDTYYSNVDDFLKLSIIFITSLIHNVERNVDKFNGDITEYSKLLDLDQSIFDSVEYLKKQ